jgi:pimeloyl-ACP methyl ester carboxylesterase
MAALGEFSGSLVLLEPSFSREDESREFAILDRVGRVPGVGQLAWVLMRQALGSAMKDELPADRHEALVAEMKLASPGSCRRLVRAYFEYLDRHGSVVKRLCDSGVRATAVFGDRSDIGLTAEERRDLDACPNVTLVDVADSGHFVFFDQPTRTAELIGDLT